MSMIKINFKRFVFSMALVLTSGLSNSAQADGAMKSLVELMTQYNQLPREVTQGMVDAMARQAQKSYYNSAAANAESDWNLSFNIDAAESIVTQKQQLQIEIYKQALVELHGEFSAGQLHELFFNGTLSTGRKGYSIPVKMSDLRGSQGLYEIMYFLTQREPAVQMLAVNILSLRGLDGKGDRTFGQSLLEYGATTATDITKLSSFLKVLSDIHFISDRYQRSGPAGSQGFFIGDFAAEVFNAKTHLNSSEPRTQAVIVQNILNQIDNTKLHERVRRDLLMSVVALGGQPAVDQRIQKILRTSTNYHELFAVIMGSNKQVKALDQSLFEGLYQAVDRLVELSAQDPRFRSLAELAVVRLVRNFEVQNDERQLDHLVPQLKKLFSHPNAAVRSFSVMGLKWKGFSRDYVEFQLMKFLTDSDYGVRLGTAQVLDLIVAPSRQVKFLSHLENLAARAVPGDDQRYLNALVTQIRTFKTDAQHGMCLALFN